MLKNIQGYTHFISHTLSLSLSLSHTHTHTHAEYKYMHYWWWVGTMRRKQQISMQERWDGVFSFDLKEESEDECLTETGRVSEHRSDVLKRSLPQGPSAHPRSIGSTALFFGWCTGDADYVFICHSTWCRIFRMLSTCMKQSLLCPKLCCCDFPGTTRVISVKHCFKPMVWVIIKLYLLTVLSLWPTLKPGHSGIAKRNWKFYFLFLVSSYPVTFKYCMVVKYIDKTMHYHANISLL